MMQKKKGNTQKRKERQTCARVGGCGAGKPATNSEICENGRGESVPHGGAFSRHGGGST